MIIHTFYRTAQWILQSRFHAFPWISSKRIIYRPTTPKPSCIKTFSFTKYVELKIFILFENVGKRKFAQKKNFCTPEPLELSETFMIKIFFFHAPENYSGAVFEKNVLKISKWKFCRFFWCRNLILQRRRNFIMAWLMTDPINSTIQN